MKVVFISIFLLKLISSEEIHFPDEHFNQPLLYQTQQYFGEPNEGSRILLEVIEPRSNPIPDNSEDDDSEGRTSNKFRPRRVLKKVKKFLRRNNLWRSVNPEINVSFGRNIDEVSTEKTDVETKPNQDVDDSVVVNNEWEDDGFSNLNITEFFDTVNPVELLETLLAQRENIDLQIQHIMQLRNAERKLRGQSVMIEPNFTICGKVQTQEIVLDEHNLPKTPIDVHFSGNSGAQILLNHLVGVKMDCSCSFGRGTDM